MTTDNNGDAPEAGDTISSGPVFGHYNRAKFVAPMIRVASVLELYRNL